MVTWLASAVQQTAGDRIVGQVNVRAGACRLDGAAGIDDVVVDDKPADAGRLQSSFKADAFVEEAGKLMLFLVFVTSF